MPISASECMCASVFVREYIYVHNSLCTYYLKREDVWTCICVHIDLYIGIWFVFRLRFIKTPRSKSKYEKKWERSRKKNKKGFVNLRPLFYFFCVNVLCCLCEIDGAREWISFGDLLHWFWEVNIGLERLVSECGCSCACACARSYVRLYASVYVFVSPSLFVSHSTTVNNSVASVRACVYARARLASRAIRLPVPFPSSCLGTRAAKGRDSRQ